MKKSTNHCDDYIFTVEMIRDFKTGVIVCEHWYRNAVTDRIDGPAMIERDPQSGIVTKEAWFNYGQLDRRDGPAVVTRRSSTGVVTYEAWYTKGELTHSRRYSSRQRHTKTSSPSL